MHRGAVANDVNAAEHGMMTACCLAAHPGIARYFDNGEELGGTHGRYGRPRNVPPQ